MPAINQHAKQAAKTVAKSTMKSSLRAAKRVLQPGTFHDEWAYIEQSGTFIGSFAKRSSGRQIEDFKTETKEEVQLRYTSGFTFTVPGLNGNQVLEAGDRILNGSDVFDVISVNPYAGDELLNHAILVKVRS